MTTLIQNLNQIEADELVSLAQKIRAWQETRKLSDNELLRKYSSLGSTKTFTRILKRDLQELDTERWVAIYRTVWVMIESLTSRETNAEELYDDLSTVAQLRRAFVEVIERTTIRRVVLVEAEQGLGKTSGLTLLQRKYGGRILPIQATVFWSDNPNSFLGAVLDAFGVRDQPAGRDDRLRIVLRKLSDYRVALAIDEAHHLGPNCLNACKTLINLSQGEIFLLALPTLWRRLERAAYEEVKQLLGNRLAERVKIGDLREADVRKVLSRRLSVDDLRAAQAVHKEATTRGNLSFVAAVCERVIEQDVTATHETVLAGIAAELARR